MTVYVRVQLSEDGVAEPTGPVEKVDMRAHASELLYGDAAYLHGLAKEQWPELNWRIEAVRTRKFIVKGDPKLRK